MFAKIDLYPSRTIIVSSSVKNSLLGTWMKVVIAEWKAWKRAYGNFVFKLFVTTCVMIDSILLLFRKDMITLFSLFPKDKYRW